MFASCTALLVLSIAGANAAPADLKHPVARRGGVDVPAILNPNKIRNGTLELHKAYNKWHLVPTKPMKSFVKRDEGDVIASITSDFAEYLCSIIIGGQSMNMDFDTGSADLWVRSSSSSSSDTLTHNIFNPSSSSTWERLSGYSWDISYADGSGVSGTVGLDTVTIGGITVENQAVELATTISGFSSNSADGLVGLAFSSINTVTPQSQTTWSENAESSLDSPLFTAYLPYESDGSYTFGYIDSSKYTGSITYTDVDSSNGFWEFPSVNYKVGSQVYSQSGYTGIADTGTTLILLGDSAVEAYYEQVDGASYDSTNEGYVFPCGTTLPSFSVKIGSSYATIPGTYMSYAAVDSYGESCYGSLQSVGSGSQNIYGDTFLNAFYAVFDYNGPQFGFAKIA